MENVTPNIFVNNMRETIAFYQHLGFSVTLSVPENSDEFVWVMMTNGQASFMFQTKESLGDELPAINRNNGGSLLFYIKLKNIREFFQSIQHKVTVLKEPETTFYGATELSIEDNNGFVLTFAEDE